METSEVDELTISSPPNCLITRWQIRSPTPGVIVDGADKKLLDMTSTITALDVDVELNSTVLPPYFAAL
ncbi:hypothetical protein EBR57_05890 [bacterium]|nr:hypothetical protein [bacterium]